MRRAAHIAAVVGFCLLNLATVATVEARRNYGHTVKHSQVYTQVKRQETQVQKQQLPHPDPCPRSLFCGCGTAMEVFKQPVRELWVASAWFKFPKAAEPAPGMVAVSHRHVFYIEKVLSGNTVLARDHNGGGGRSWLQVRSLNGYTVVNPRG